MSRDDGQGSPEVMKLVVELNQARAAGAAAVRKFFADNFDLDALATYMAVINWLSPWDDFFQNHYLYHRPDGRWMLMPTDMDNVMGLAPPSAADATFFTGVQNARSNRNDYWNYLKDAYLKAYRKEFLDKVRELDRTVLAPESVWKVIDDMTADYALDEAALSPAGVCSLRPQDNVARMKQFAVARHQRIADGMFD
jgi:hypothetical protein